MFDFLDSDWFNITLNIVFIVLIVWDIKRYKETKKKEYLTNIVLTVAFGIWALYPYYVSYFEWNEAEKKQLLQHCDEQNSSICRCVDEAIFKEYSAKEYAMVDKNATEFLEFLVDAKKECLGEDDGWF